MAGGCGVGAFCTFCGKCGRTFGSVFGDIEVPQVAPPGVSEEEEEAKEKTEAAKTVEQKQEKE
ncbi:MAG TPA: hypothetical protein IAC28_08030 [Candidatus Aphodovivens excrementavium]|nr:hypothetical protein [Candidatus Aphodovivens excrementavium]